MSVIIAVGLAMVLLGLVPLKEALGMWARLVIGVLIFMFFI